MKNLLKTVSIFFLGSCGGGSVVNVEDPYLWLEEVEGEEALQWVQSQNNITQARYESSESFDSTYQFLLDEYNSDDRIPYAYIQNGEMYNFWRDESNVRGVWRKTSIESYQTEEIEWENILDIDQLAQKEGKNWVWRGASCLAPDYEKCLVRLSDGGKDAIVIREFDLANKQFISDGFIASESKQYFSWLNEDELLIATNFGPDSMNESGYPRQVKVWNRAQGLEEAKLIFDGDYEKIFSFPFSSIRPDGSYFGVLEGPTFFTKVLHLFKGQELVKLDLPLKIDVYGTYENLLIISLAEEWQGFGVGDLVAVDIDDALEKNITSDSLTLLFEPTKKSFLRSVSIGHKQILVSILDNISGQVLQLQKVGDTWIKNQVRGFEGGMLSVSSVDSWSDHTFLNSQGFTESASLYYSDGSKEFKKIKSGPSKFNPEQYNVEQLYATSRDGTLIPYFQISNVDMVRNSKNPTLLYGYGGFEISQTPSYLSAFSRAWLDSGGVYVIANIRGGGEFGPNWHQAALKENRQRAYDDFIAVGETLISTGVTSSEHLGIRGGSNGGLLVGAVVAQRPDLFNAVICAVPLLDMYRYDKLLAGASWVDEYGDPDNPEEWSFISKYSPYQNVFADKNYPEIYFYTSTKDDRVHPGHARKMAKKMLDQGHEVIYYENIEGGHSAAANLKQSAYMATLQLEYLKDKLL
ncbi:MAG: prolyl oligopeptidase family serine peptidase [Proteobacteria bacterium]|nr:prolyl oligopeptidase family serine peptidase [Pseudomonadota bacterium]